MRNSYLQDIIHSLNKSKNKLIYVDELKKIFRGYLGSTYTDKKGYKIIYHLKNKGYLVALKKDIFCLTHPDQLTDEHDLISQYYRSILHRHATSLSPKRYIGGCKALELHYQNTDIPDQIIIINQAKQTQDSVITGKFLHAKTYTYQGNNLFGEFFRFTKKIKIGKHAFPLANKELAMLEALFSYDELTDRYTAEYIKKVLKKYEPDLEIIEQLLQIGKHHTSINRLLELISIVRPKMSEPLRKIIKKYSFLLSV